ncbi:MAG: cell wall-binding repeat-containing protein, partial [Coriobacteriia bacterium]|nr:cell wall-binding repeat-containing protein [Coriobacteriia bacterium]
PLTDAFEGYLHDPADQSDVYRVYLLAGQNININLTGPVGADYDLFLHEPSSVDFTGPYAAWASGPAPNETINHTATQTGWYYLRVYADFGFGTYTLITSTSWPVPQPPDTPYRLWGSDRYETAVEIARENFPGWQNVDHVIIASGEDRAAADPLAASGLVWTYGAPIFLVRSDRIPSSVMNSLMIIASVNGPPEIHVVGGPVSIPQQRLSEIAAVVPGATFDRIAPYGDRFTLAASIAHRMNSERPGDHWGSPFATPRALIANGADAEKFFDALALSPIAAKNGFPILLVREDSIPGPTQAALTSLGLNFRIVAGGPNTISDAVVADLDAGASTIVYRWSGRDRYETARVIMNNARALFFPRLLNTANVGVTAKLPDALTGGAFIGLRGGSILVTRKDWVPTPTYEFLHNNTTQIGECYVFGGVNSITDDTMLDIGNALVP